MARKDDLNLVERTMVDLADYSGLQLDKLKLRLLDNFSVLINTILSTVVIILLGSFALLALAVAGVWGLGSLLGNHLLAILIVGGVFIILVVLAWLMRKKLFINTTVRLLGRIMFEPDKEREGGYE